MQRLAGAPGVLAQHLQGGEGGETMQDDPPAQRRRPIAKLRRGGDHDGAVLGQHGPAPARPRLVLLQPAEAAGVFDPDRLGGLVDADQAVAAPGGKMIQRGFDHLRGPQRPARIEDDADLALPARRDYRLRRLRRRRVCVHGAGGGHHLRPGPPGKTGERAVVGNDDGPADRSGKPRLFDRVHQQRPAGESSLQGHARLGKRGNDGDGHGTPSRCRRRRCAPAGDKPGER